MHKSSPAATTPRRNLFALLPSEICHNIFCHLAISTRNYSLCTALWRPVGVDGYIYRIGYFAKDHILPLLLVCRKFHDEVAAVLYGENIFAFHISGLSSDPLAFLRMSPVYIHMLKKVIIRTGYFPIEHEIALPIPAACANVSLPPDQGPSILRRELAISAALVRQAWPSEYNVKIDLDNVEVCEVSIDGFTIVDLRRTDKRRWPAIVGYVWTMVVDNLTSGESVRTFRRINWQPYDFRCFSESTTECIIW